MTFRSKLILSFITVILMILLIFSAVAYTSARDYTQYNGQILVHKENLRLISQLGPQPPSLEQIQQLFPSGKNADQLYILIDTQTGELASTGKNANAIQLQQKIAHSLHSETKASTLSVDSETNKNDGVISFNGEEYLWASNSIPNTPYKLVSTYRHTENNIQTFLKYIGTPLAITLFIGMWIALWASAILTNLFKKIDDTNSQLQFQAHHDSLTQLPNRDALSRVTQHAIESAKAADGEIIFCLIDIEGLKDINDSLGHENGDILLNQISQRLKGSLRATDHIGRFGGNKFAVILSHTQTNNIESLCNKLLENFETVFEIDTHKLYVRAILGISIFPIHADNSQVLIQKAETALYKARKIALDFAIYDVSLDKNNAERLKLTHDLRNAIHNEELKLYYQPQLDIRTGRIISVEALARWIHPEQGFIPPDIFIEIAEQAGLIQSLTDWVMRTAIEQCSNWLKIGIEVAVSVNLSARNLHDETLGTQVSNLLNYWGIKPSQLCLEITETSMMTNPEHARTLLDGLDNLGVRISIDDFGTGYSSLAYLKQLPVDELKVDKSFVLNMSSDESDASIVRATVSLAHDPGLEVVAEGVEDQATQDELLKIGCEFIQGYHFARPMPAAELTPLLASNQAENNGDKAVVTPTVLQQQSR
ncbi:MAG: bifunctional diguanylate cyclase/phosphodiesterase [Porticoccus sp.]|nr:bifunctional diguanylate cyclase/phosphodiesterase [Porticoccus sp.]